MTEMIIGLAGKARVGKSTAATLLAQGHGFYEIKFADPVKRMVRSVFGWGLEHTDGVEKDKVDQDLGFSPRQALQHFGAAGRELRADLWLLLAKREYERARRRQSLTWQGAVFSDVRTEAEAAMVRRLGGEVVHIQRPGVQAVRDDATETGVQFFVGDRLLLNTGTVSDLRSSLEGMLAKIEDGDA